MYAWLDSGEGVHRSPLWAPRSWTRARWVEGVRGRGHESTNVGPIVDSYGTPLHLNPVKHTCAQPKNSQLNKNSTKLHKVMENFPRILIPNIDRQSRAALDCRRVPRPDWNCRVPCTPQRRWTRRERKVPGKTSTNYAGCQCLLRLDGAHRGPPWAPRSWTRAAASDQRRSGGDAGGAGPRQFYRSLKTTGPGSGPKTLKLVPVPHAIFQSRICKNEKMRFLA